MSRTFQHEKKKTSVKKEKEKDDLLTIDRYDTVGWKVESIT